MRTPYRNGRRPNHLGALRYRALALLACACGTDATTSDETNHLRDGGGLLDAEAPPVAVSGRLIGVPVVVHPSQSEMSPARLVAVLTEVNRIWASADVCFDFQIVPGDAVTEDALDLFFTASTIVDSQPGTNGVYRGPDEIWTLDEPVLAPAPNPARIPASRTAAHELGHALGLSHQNCGNACPCESPKGLFCDDFLMRSGTLGAFVSDVEIDQARRWAASLGEPVARCEAP